MITRIEQRFNVKRPREQVFDYVADPANAPAWQASRLAIELLTDGPLQKGTRIRGRGKALRIIPVEEISEITTFDRPSHVETTVLEGPVMPVRSSYEFGPDGAGTMVHVVYEYGATGFLERSLIPLTRRIIARRLAGYNRKLARILNAG